MRALLMLTALTMPAAAETLRPFVTLTSAQVRLSDLFEGAPDRAIGPAPAPGGQIVVEAAQLAAIARGFGVDWRPASSSDRAILERPGRPLPREAMLAALRPALAAAGAPTDSEIELATDAPNVPLSGGGQASAQGLDYDASSGRFSAALEVPIDGAAPIRGRVAGQVVGMVDVPVPVHRLNAGDPIGRGDVQLTRLRLGTVHEGVVRSLAGAIGLAPRHAMAPGVPMPVAELGAPVLVQKGASVRMGLDGPGLALTAQGVATEPGGLGERIRVLNPSSRTVVEGEIIGPGRVRVVPGSVLPATLAQQVAAR